MTKSPARATLALVLALIIGVGLSTAIAATTWETPTAAPRLRDGSAQTFELTGRNVLGYQGWFMTPGDGNPAPVGWRHWFSQPHDPSPSNATFDAWPDLSEFDEDELHASPLLYPNGTAAKLFSSHSPRTINRHFTWMQQYGIDGVFLQRFVQELADPHFLTIRNNISKLCQHAAAATGRGLAIMYDVSGAESSTLYDAITKDWVALDFVNHTTVHWAHRGQPVVAVWGMGFVEHPPDQPNTAKKLIDWFNRRGVAVLGGVPTHWRTNDQDARPEEEWQQVYSAYDILSPWSVGRYGGDSVSEALDSADRFLQDQIVPDMLATSEADQAYMPVIWPGFSWSHLMQQPKSGMDSATSPVLHEEFTHLHNAEIETISKAHSTVNSRPRFAGQFYWRQAVNALHANATMLYTAMFDEVDEGTAMFKVSPSLVDAPQEAGHRTWLTLDQDGYHLPSDWYLTLAGNVSACLAAGTPIGTMPALPDAEEARRVTNLSYAVLLNEVPSEERLQILIDTDYRHRANGNLTTLCGLWTKIATCYLQRWDASNLTTHLYDVCYGREPTKAERSSSEAAMKDRAGWARETARVVAQCV